MAQHPSVCLITVASGELYVRFARKMMVTASDHFKPSKNVALRVLKGRDGEWPIGTISRYHTILEHEADLEFDYLFHIDADMSWRSRCGDEILGDGITATQHPGYVGMPVDLLPYERRSYSAAYVKPGDGENYYAGGFIGGRRDDFLRLAEAIARIVDADATNGTCPTWHDESAANRWLIDNPPVVTLSPAYCFPQDPSWYQSALWQEEYEPVLVALDKTAEERQGR